MNKILKNTILILSVIFFSIGCATKPQPQPKSQADLSKQEVPKNAPKPNYTYDITGIELNVTASHKLNIFDGFPHTIIVALYQLTSTESFIKLTQTKQGMEKLLTATDFDQSVVAVNTFIIQPGMDSNITQFRAKDATYIGVVAGYYDLSPNLSVYTQSIPVVYKEHGIWPFNSYTAEVKKSLINLNFTEYSLQATGYYYESN